jgi:hypothetical protein
VDTRRAVLLRERCDEAPGDALDAADSSNVSGKDEELALARPTRLTVT